MWAVNRVLLPAAFAATLFGCGTDRYGSTLSGLEQEQIKQSQKAAFTCGGRGDGTILRPAELERATLLVGFARNDYLNTFLYTHRLYCLDKAGERKVVCGISFKRNLYGYRGEAQAYAILNFDAPEGGVLKTRTFTGDIATKFCGEVKRSHAYAT